MNILMLNYEYPPLGGGAGIATRNILERFRGDDSLNVDLVTSSSGPASLEKFSDNINIHYLDINKKGGRLHSQSQVDLLNYSVRALEYSRDLMEKKEYDIVHAFFGVPCGFIAMMLGKPFIISLRGSDVPFHNPRFRVMDILVFSWLSRIVWKRAERVIANSETLRTSANRVMPGRKIEVIPNGADTEAFSPSGEQRKDDEFRILYAGRLGTVKNVLGLVRAFSIIKRQRPSGRFKLWIAGDGGLKGQMEADVRAEGIESDVKFFGIVPNKDMPDIYRSADVFILPSVNEGMSVAMLEAMSSGLPVICSESAASGVAAGDCGAIIKKGTPEEIAEAVLAVFDAPGNARAAFSRASRRRAGMFSWKNTADNYKKIYRDVI